MSLTENLNEDYECEGYCDSLNMSVSMNLCVSWDFRDSYRAFLAEVAALQFFLLNFNKIHV